MGVPEKKNKTIRDKANVRNYDLRRHFWNNKNERSEPIYWKNTARSVPEKLSWRTNSKTYSGKITAL